MYLLFCIYIKWYLLYILYEIGRILELYHEIWKSHLIANYCMASKGQTGDWIVIIIFQCKLLVENWIKPKKNKSKNAFH